MATTNRERVGKGLELLRQGLVPFIEGLFRGKLGDGFRDTLKARFDLKGQKGGAIHWDNQALLKLFLQPDVWKELLDPAVGKGARSYAGELVDVRNRHAHDEPFSSEQAERALDTMRLLLLEAGATREAEEVQQLRHDLQRQVYSEMARQKVRSGLLIEGSPKACGGTMSTSPSASWPSGLAAISICPG